MKRRAFVFLALLAGVLPLARAADGPEDPLARAVLAARDRVYPALVNIQVIMQEFVGGRAIHVPAAGSGVIVSPAGHVLTNFHVAESSIRLVCNLPSGESIPADVVTHDPLTDLSVLKLRMRERTDPMRPLAFASFGDSDKLQIGQRVLALGNPRGLDSSLTLGVVANVNRVFKSFTGSSIENLELSEGQPTGLFTRYIQHDALIQPGNSGGPLVNLDGEVVGINELGGGGMGFAIPSNLAKEVLNRALAFGKIERGWLGVTVLPTRPIDRDSGALVAFALPGHPAANVGIQPGDVLLSIDEHQVAIRRFEDVPPFYAWASNLPIGSRHEVTWLRGAERMTGTIEVGKMEPALGDERAFPHWGVSAMSITGPMAFARGYPDTRGVVLTSIRPGKPPEVARPSLARGDVVLAIGGDPVDGLDGLAALYDQHHTEKDLLVHFRRGRSDMVTALDMTREAPRRRGTELAKAWLGVETQVLTPEVSRALGLDGKKGFRVTRVFPATEAEKAGLRSGDVLVAIDGDALDAWRLQDAEILRRRIEELDIGSSVKLDVLRDGKPASIEVVLQESPEAAADVKSASDDVLEYKVRDLTYRDKVDNEWPLDTKGVLVVEAESGGWASVAGLESGDLVIEIEGTPIPDVKAFEAVVARLDKERPKRVRMFVRRDRTTTFVFPEPDWPK